jgi:hypothetical protein
MRRITSFLCVPFFLHMQSLVQASASSSTSSNNLNAVIGKSTSRRSPFLVLSSTINQVAFLLRGGGGADDSDKDDTENDTANDSSDEKPLENLQVMLRGTKYTISGVSTVAQLIERVQQESGNHDNKPHDVLFGGKRLQASDNLRAVGVQDGAQLNLVPATTTTTTSSSSSSSSSSSKKSSKASAATDAAAAASVATASTSDSANAMQEYLKSAGVDPDKLNDLMKSLGGDGASSGGSGAGGSGAGAAAGIMPDMSESLDMMTNMMSSPLFQEYMSNPEMLEQSRQMILQNPMLKSMMANMPGMGDIINDADAWKEAMQAAANIYKNMDPEQLKTIMKGMGGMPGAGIGGFGMPPPGMGGMGMPPPGLFDGTLDGASSSSSSSSSAATAAALDELDEDD